MGIALRHNRPDSVLAVRIDCKNISVCCVRKIKISVAHKALLFVSRIFCVFVNSENAVVCNAPFCAVLSHGLLSIFIIERVFDVIGRFFASVFIACDNLLEIFSLADGGAGVVLTGFCDFPFRRGFNNFQRYRV